MSDRTATGGSPAGGARWRARLGALAFWLGLLALVGGGAGLLTPSGFWVLDERHPLALDALRPEQGKAWIVPLGVEGLEGSRQGFTSPVVLHEDGVPLRRVDNHARLREQGDGCFSVWGERVWFAPSGDADPREAGRTYELVVPAAGERPGRRALTPLAAGGAVLLLLGLVLSFQLARVALAVGACAALAWQVRDLLPLWRLDGSLERARQTLAVVPDEAARAAPPRVGNVTRLALETFEGDAPVGESRPPLELSLAVEGGRTGRDGRVRLASRDGEVVGALGEDGLHACRLAEVMVLGTFAAGDELEVQLDRRVGRQTRSLRLSVPVVASPEPQVLRIARPLRLYQGCEDSALERVVLRAPASDQDGLLVRIDGVSLVDELSVYRGRSHGSEGFQVGAELRRAAWQSVPGAFVVPWEDGAGRLLKGAVSLRHGDHGASAEVELSAVWEDGRRERLLGRRLDATPTWHELRGVLPDGPPPARLELACRDLPADGVLAWSGWRAVDDSRAPRRVLLTLMDTLRADALSCYDDDGAATPFLDGLAGRGVLFEQAISQCYWTRPSMVSLMTSRHVQDTGIHRFEKLPASYDTLPEVFARAGFYAVGTVSNHNASADAGLDQGWDELREEHDHLVDVEAGVFCSRFVEPRLEDLLEEDLFVYVHLMDAHGPYGPKQAPAEPPADDGPALAFDPGLDRPWNERPTAASRRAWYLRDVAVMDGGWGAFVERQRARWLAAGGDEPILAVMSDHGEFLGEEEQWNHIHYALLPPVVHVPLIVSAPGRLPAGRRVATPVRNLDVAPTLLALAGVGEAPPEGWQGRSLVALVDGGQAPGPALSSGGAPPSLFAVYGPDGAVVGRSAGATRLLDGSGRELDLARLEEDLLNDLQRRALGGLRGAFQRTWDAYVERGDAIRRVYWQDVDESVSLLDPAAIEQLRQFGYLGR